MTNETQPTTAHANRIRATAKGKLWPVVAATASLALSAAAHGQAAPPPAAGPAATTPAATVAPGSPQVQITQGTLLQAQTPAAQAEPGQELTPATADGQIHVARLSRTPPLERRIQVMTKELNLDPKQQAQIRKILENQRDAVRKIWSDPAVLPPERTAATQAQAEHAGDAIRAVLNDDQQKLYNRSRTDNPLPPGDQRSVEQWMDAAKGKAPASP